MKNIAVLPWIFLACVVGFILTGCASTCAPNDAVCRQNAMNDAAVVGAGIGAALDVLSILDAPDQPTHTETRTCTTDFWGDQHCTVTVETHR